MTQRKGQWLINSIRDSIDYSIIPHSLEKAIELKIWNMTDEEFDKIMNTLQNSNDGVRK